jgi:hypothetical protein
MELPYTTRAGVKIGLQHINNPKPYQIIDEDMLMLQQALLTPHGRKAPFILRFTQILRWARY